MPCIYIQKYIYIFILSQTLYIESLTVSSFSLFIILVNACLRPWGVKRGSAPLHRSSISLCPCSVMVSLLQLAPWGRAGGCALMNACINIPFPPTPPLKPTDMYTYTYPMLQLGKVVANFFKGFRANTKRPSNKFCTNTTLGFRKALSKMGISSTMSSSIF